jgi:alpha-tubulin suppressor-like RCC1 family protein
MFHRVGPHLLALTVPTWLGCASPPAPPVERAAERQPAVPAAPAPTPAITVAAPPTIVTPPPRTTIVAGSSHTCALVTMPGSAVPRVKCWGTNDFGELGLGDRHGRGAKKKQMGAALPALALPEGAPIVALAATNHRSCALRDDGTLHCWGDESDDQKPTVLAELPAVALPGRVEAVTIGVNHACAVLVGGGVVCWGNNSDGQLGYGDEVARTAGPTLPLVDLGAGLAARALVTGHAHNCALFTSDATLVKCWGLGGDGELGLDDITDRGDAPGEMGAALPRAGLGAGFQVASLSAGMLHTCALSTDQRLKCWGNNRSGQLGYGHTNSPGRKPGQSRAVAPMGDRAAGRRPRQRARRHGRHRRQQPQLRARPPRRRTRGVKCWGTNGTGSLGLGDDRPAATTPTRWATRCPSSTSARTSSRSPSPSATDTPAPSSSFAAAPKPAGGSSAGAPTTAVSSASATPTNTAPSRSTWGDALPFVDLGVDVRVVVPPRA